ncbi:DinB family protein [Ferruginibacter yonginensis]|uniref:DinB family protein n=1 Tax=Ferruginibacter yonginensis TaxID=1310416 RepID=A0ABV8QXT2_9BACT
MKKLQALIHQLNNLIAQQATINNSISMTNVGWHIEHSLLTINVITNAIKNAEPTNFKKRFNFAKLMVFTLNKIPRGRAKVPDVVKPLHFDAASLQQHVQLTTQNIQTLQTIGSDQYFKHPFFGYLNIKETIKFLNIHTNHHLKIIKDIIKN